MSEDREYMASLRLGMRVLVHRVRTEDDVILPAVWEPGVLAGLHWTSVHVQFPDGSVLALPADGRGRTWRA